MIQSYSYDEVHGLHGGAGLDSLSRSALGVGFWGELVEALDGAVGDSGQGGGEIFSHRQGESAAGFDDGEDSRELRGRSPDLRWQVRQARARPLLDSMRNWMQESLSSVTAIRPGRHAYRTQDLLANSIFSIKR